MAEVLERFGGTGSSWLHDSKGVNDNGKKFFDITFETSSDLPRVRA